MDKNNTTMKIKSKDEYIKSMHKLGRIGTICALIVMIGMPVMMSVVYGTFPGVKMILQASAGLLAIFVPVAISEVISYTPILGSSIYLTLITGNVMNLKLPVATNAMKIMDVEYGSEDADVISAISISVSSAVTIGIIILGVLLMVPLTPVLTVPAVKTATGYILPALFGSMALGMFSDSIGGGVRAKNRMLAAVLPALIIAVIYFMNKQIVTQFQGFLIIGMLPLTYFGSKLLYNKGIIKVTLPTDGEQPKKEKE